MGGEFYFASHRLYFPIYMFYFIFLILENDSYGAAAETVYNFSYAVKM